MSLDEIDRLGKIERRLEVLLAHSEELTDEIREVMVHYDAIVQELIRKSR